jgi:hypothetical protein
VVLAGKLGASGYLDRLGTSIYLKDANNNADTELGAPGARWHCMATTFGLTALGAPISRYYRTLV